MYNLDQGTIQVAITAAAAAGSFVIGRRAANKEAIDIASETVDMLQAQIESLKDDKQERDEEVADLKTRVRVLESLVTQRAEVAEVKDVVVRIASHLGA